MDHRSSPAGDGERCSVDSDDEIRFTCNRQGEVTSIRDQNGTVHAFDHDLLGRQLHDRITTLGAGGSRDCTQLISDSEV